VVALNSSYTHGGNSARTAKNLIAKVKALKIPASEDPTQPVSIVTVRSVGFLLVYSSLCG
jgi:hypothetical protein